MPPADPRTASAGPAGAFSRETLEWLAQAGLADRKALGQYMTPRPVREALADRLDLFAGMRVLDPGAGTGEFLAAVREREPAALLSGWDVDSGILAFARRNVPGASFEQRSALDGYGGEPFDLVIGNPPYFQFRASARQKRRFAAVISGRPNIFALFFQAALELARPGGQVAFVVPPSMNNGAYFEALRNHIVERGAIEHLEILDGNGHFEQANTAAQLIVIRVGGRSPAFHLERTCPDSGFHRTIFSPVPERIEREFPGRSTLRELGFEAVTGTVVWNRNRARLARRPQPGAVPLIWAHNVGRGELRLDPDHRRPQYLRDVTPLAGPAVVVNRVVGAVGRGELRAAPVPAGMEFLAENHVNVIRARPGTDPRLEWSRLAAAINAPGVVERVRLLTGNTQVSAQELTHLLPLDHP